MTSKESIPSLLELFSDEYSWFLPPWKELAVLTMPDLVAKRIDIPDSLLTAAHPDFARAVYGLLQTEGKTRGSLVRDTLMVLNGEVLVVPKDRAVSCVLINQNCHGLDKLRTEHIVMNGVDRLTVEKDGVWIFGRLLTIKTTEFEGRAIPMVARSEMFKLVVSLEYLNEIKPGWQARYATGVDLGFEGEELMREVFKKQSSHTVANVMPTLTFD